MIYFAQIILKTRFSLLQVYGETSFELICQILDKLSPVGPDNKFIDLGSGVGQVVLQVAALTDCEMTFGIEKASTPANYAKVIVHPHQLRPNATLIVFY